jgi:hypothetical protein
LIENKNFQLLMAHEVKVRVFARLRGVPGQSYDKKSEDDPIIFQKKTIDISESVKKGAAVGPRKVTTL